MTHGDLTPTYHSLSLLTAALHWYRSGTKHAACQTFSVTCAGPSCPCLRPPLNIPIMMKLSWVLGKRVMSERTRGDRGGGDDKVPSHIRNQTPSSGNSLLGDSALQI